MNWSLTTSLNPGTDFTWIVVENSEHDSNKKLPIDDTRFSVVDGVPNTWTGAARGSYHHAAGLNKALSLATTRYVLILDPDCFIVRRNWIQDIVEHMQTRQLSFLGAPYYPDRPTKYRYFPCGTCMFIDLERVSNFELDFTPEIDEMVAVASLGWHRVIAWVLTGHRPSDEQTLVGISRDQAWDALRIMFIRKVLLRLGPVGLMGLSRDGGYRIYRLFYHNDDHPSECLVPAWENPLFTRTVFQRKFLKQTAARWLLPDKLSPYPKRRDYTTQVSFCDFGFSDFPDVKREEYFWHQEPFGVHIRGVFQGTNIVDELTVSDLVKQFLV